ncbi:MAG: type 4b pilus protein PilO2 [Betaproteobacteria bacterium]|nr:type 4b pilus protein PilO2 [Betaproteobacteria bacterium]
MNTTVSRAGAMAKPAAKRKKQSSGYVAALGDHSIAFGMLWDRLPGVKIARSTVSKAATKYSASSYVALPAKEGKRSIGLLADSAGVERGASRKAAASAAALLAIAYPGVDNAVFGLALPGGKIAFIGFRAGVPLIGFDRIVGNDVLDELTADFLKEFDEQSAPTVQFHGAADIFPGRAVVEFDSDWFDTLTKKALAAARLRRAKAPTALIIGAVLAAAAAYGALTLYDQHQQESIKKVVPVVQDPQVVYNKSATEYLSAATTGSYTAGPMTDKINQLPMFHQGWRLDKASCTPDSCTLTWTNSDGGTYLSFAAASLPGIAKYETNYKEGMTGLETTFEIKNNVPKGMQIADLPKQEQFIVNFGSQAQQMKEAGLAITLDKASVVAIPAAPAGSPPITESTLKEKVAEGTWAMTGDWTFYQALASLPKNMTVDKLEVGVAGDSMVMSATGKYYVKK